MATPVDFKPPYSFLLKEKKWNGNDEPLKCIHVYIFTCRHGYKYVVDILEYKRKFFGVKFHLKRHNNQKNKFKILTGKYDGRNILDTVIGIMLDIRKKNDGASFGFMGMPKENENINTTKRFKVYRLVAKKNFNPDKFHHIENSNNSTYLIVDKSYDIQPYILLAQKIIDDEIAQLSECREVNLGRSTN